MRFSEKHFVDEFAAQGASTAPPPTGCTAQTYDPARFGTPEQADDGRRQSGRTTSSVSVESTGSNVGDPGKEVEDSGDDVEDLEDDAEDPDDEFEDSGNGVQQPPPKPPPAPPDPAEEPYEGYYGRLQELRETVAELREDNERRIRLQILFPGNDAFEQYAQVTYARVRVLIQKILDAGDDFPEHTLDVLLDEAKNLVQRKPADQLADLLPLQITFSGFQEIDWAGSERPHSPPVSPRTVPEGYAPVSPCTVHGRNQKLKKKKHHCGIM
jgi:hypothetical protein